MSTVPDAISEPRAPRLAELDAQIRGEAARRQGRPQRKPRRRSTPRLPAAVRKEVTRAARELNGRARPYFMADPKLKDRTARFLRSLLLPKPRRRGRPGIPSVTKALALLKKYRRKHPGEKAARIWEWIYPEAIPNYGAMGEVQQCDARAELIARVKDRIKKRKRRARKSLQGN